MFKSLPWQSPLGAGSRWLASLFALFPWLVRIERWKEEMPQSMVKGGVADGVGDRVTVMHW